MHRLIALFFARNKEYYRDKSSLVWSFIMPPMIIGLMALAFSPDNSALFSVGVQGEANQHPFDSELVKSASVKDLATGQRQVAYHQIDMLLDPATHTYWINPTSQKGKTLQALLPDAGYQGQNIEGNPIRYVDWVVPGILGMNLMFSGLWGIGYVIVRYRKNGVLKRLQATPTHPVEFLAAQMLSRLMIMLGVSTIVYMSCDLMLDFVMLGSYWHLILVAVVGNLSMLALGLVVAARISSEEFANGLLNFISFPMMMVSEVWFSLEGAPHWLTALANLSPLTHMVKAARAIMIEGAGLADIAPHLFALLVMTTAMLALAGFLFRWQKG